MSHARRLTALVATLLTLALVLGALPAFGEPSTPTVVFHVTVAGTDLFGMDAATAHAAIAAACTTPTLEPLDAVAAETTFTLYTCNKEENLPSIRVSSDFVVEQKLPGGYLILRHAVPRKEVERRAQVAEASCTSKNPHLG